MKRTKFEDFINDGKLTNITMSTAHDALLFVLSSIASVDCTEHYYKYHDSSDNDNFDRLLKEAQGCTIIEDSDLGRKIYAKVDRIDEHNTYVYIYTHCLLESLSSSDKITGEYLEFRSYGSFTKEEEHKICAAANKLLWLHNRYNIPININLESKVVFSNWLYMLEDYNE